MAAIAQAAPAAAEPPPLFEKRIVYRKSLSCAAARPPKGAVYLTATKAAAGAGKKGAGAAAAAQQASDPTRPPPGTELCDETALDGKMGWKVVKAPSVGLINTGVTCYINATLQCLIHTPPLANYLVGYTTSHRGAGIDWLEALAGVTKFATMPAAPRKHHNPTSFTTNLRRLSSTLRRGRLEDAQEFCNFLLDAAHTYQLKKYSDVKDPLVQETTPMKRIFGGFFRSEIRWKKDDELAALRAKASKTKKPVSSEAAAAPASSSTYEPFMFLTLELVGGSVERSLLHFSKPEHLNGENKYVTPTGVKVDAQKVFTVYRTPRVLIIHLKRFVSNMFGQTKKINKYTEFSATLDMSKHASGPGAGEYEVYGVVVHHGGGLHSGHYTAYVKSSNGLWYCCDDELISQAREADVMKAQAYLLFYKLKGTPAPVPVPEAQPNGAPASPKATANGTPNGNGHAAENGVAKPAANGVSRRQEKLERQRAKAEKLAAEADAKAKAEALQAAAQMAAAAKAAAEREAAEKAAAAPAPTANGGSAKRKIEDEGEDRPKKKAKRAKTVLRENGHAPQAANGTANGGAGAQAKAPKRKRDDADDKPKPSTAADGADPPSPTNPLKKRRKMLRKAAANGGGKYASAALNAGATFEMPTDTEAYWTKVEKDDKAVAEEAAAAAWTGKDNSADDTLVLNAPPADSTVDALVSGLTDGAEAADKEAAPAKPAPKSTSTRAAAVGQPQQKEAENPLVAAQQEVASYRASAALESKANANAAVWDCVDQSVREAMLRKTRPSKKTKKEIMNEEWNRQLDAGKQKKMAKWQRGTKGHMAGHDAFQKGSEAKQEKRAEEDRQKAEGTWEGNEKSDRSKRKERARNRAYERFH
eukprot:TRINITY_DN24736_c0_g1_i1.p1 TRINITY_DN24736_c0_g1~~TRINITY_DN24736_c0_g1_i1.p1  ORF type:complete len:872 (+),score=351.71 TRINITY_DN24736_c0_g1_i1:52-2667(+)